MTTSSVHVRRRRARAAIAGLVAITAAVVGGLVPGAPSGAATTTVCAAGCDFTSIAAATAAAVNGDVITVAAGTYHEPRIVISQKGITLQGAGAGQTIIDGQLRNDLVGGEGQIRVESAAAASGPIRIEGLTIRNAPKTPTGSIRYAVQVKASRPDPSAITFDDVDIEGAAAADYGMYVNGTAGVAEAPFTFTNGSITGTQHHAILFENWRRAVTVEDSTFTETTGSGAAIVGFSSDARPERTTEPFAFRRNTFTGNSLLLYRFSSGVNQGFDSIIATDNTFSGLAGADTAINLGATGAGPGTPGFPTTVQVEGNSVSGTGASTRGLAIGSGPNGPVGAVTATGNSFAGIGTGIATTGTSLAGPVDLTFNRFRSTVGVANSTGTVVDATKSWWGCNAGPGAPGCSTATSPGTTTTSSWITASMNVHPTTVDSKGSASITGKMLHTVNGIQLADLPAVFDAVPVSFSALAGSITPSSGTLTDGRTPIGTYTAPVGPGADTVTVTIDGVAMPVDIGVRGSGIHGAVYAEVTSEPIAGLQVRLYKDGAATSAARTTDAKGRFSFGNLTTGSYELWYRDVANAQWVSEYHHDALTRAAGTPIAFTTGDVVVANASLAAKPPVIPVTFRTIQGTVTDPEGDPIPGIQVRLYAAPYTGGSASTTTDAQGHYEFNRRTAGQYKLWFRDVRGTTWVSAYDGDASTLEEADGVTLTEQADLTVNTTLQPRPTDPGTATGTISGRVIDEQDGQPIAGIQVRLYLVGGTGSSATTTAADGTFSFPGRPVGDYQLWARDLSGQWVSEYYDDATSLATAGWINVAPSLVTDIGYVALAPRTSGA